MHLSLNKIKYIRKESNSDSSGGGRQKWNTGLNGKFLTTDNYHLLQLQYASQNSCILTNVLLCQLSIQMKYIRSPSHCLGRLRSLIGEREIVPLPFLYPTTKQLEPSAGLGKSWLPEVIWRHNACHLKPSAQVS